MKRVFNTSVALMIAAATCVNAQETSQFGGFYTGVDVGLTLAKSSLTKDKASLFTKSNFSNTGMAYGLFAGYGKTFSNNFYIGLEVSLRGDTSKIKHQFTEAVAVILGETSLTTKNSMMFGVAPRFGYVFGKAMVYFKPGLEFKKVTITSSDTTDSTSSKFGMLFNPELGLDYKFSQNLFGRISYAYSTGGLAITDKDQNIKNYKKFTTLSNHRIAVGVAYQF